MDRSRRPMTIFRDDGHQDDGEVSDAATGYNFLVKQQPSEKDHQNDESSSRVSSSDQVDGCDDDDEGFKTPTSLDHKIPTVLPCPPAPRKPTIAPSLMKRKAPRGRRSIVTLDVTNDEIESVFSLATVRKHFHGKIKKVRDVNVKANSDYDLVFSGTSS